MVLDDELEAKITEILRPLMSRWPGLDLDAVREANRKQAVVPLGATVLDPVGTAPGLVVPPAVRIRPDGRGPPGAAARAARDVGDGAVDRGVCRRDRRGRSIVRRIVRLFGIPESEIANTLRAASEAGVPLEELEITTCLRRGEIEVATRYEPPGRRRIGRSSTSSLRAMASSCSRSTARRSTRRWHRCLGSRMVAVAESCTGGLMSARLTELPGSSAYFAGGVVVYSNEAKVSFADVDPDLIIRFGAVSTEVAEALASGAAARFDAAYGIGITGIAGPDGGTEEKPVGTVCFSVCGPEARASPAVRGSPVAGRTSATARRRSPCTCSAGCSWRGRRRFPRQAPGAEPGVSAAGRRRPLGCSSRSSFPTAAREALVRWRSSVAGDVAGLRFVRPEDLHATLCFLGSRPEDEIDVIAAACGVVAGEPVADSGFGDALWLPARRPRVLAVALADPDGVIARVQSVLSDALVAGGWYAPESRPFLAHVTVARVGRDARVRAV